MVNLVEVIIFILGLHKINKILAFKQIIKLNFDKKMFFHLNNENIHDIYRYPLLTNRIIFIGYFCELNIDQIAPDHSRLSRFRTGMTSAYWDL